MRRRLTALTFVALSAMVAPAVTTGTGAAEPLRLTVGTLGSIGSLDARTGESPIAREVWKIQYPTLTAVDATTLGPTAGVAIAWTPLPRGNGWRYTLRPNLTWSDGKPVTAADVVYSLERAREDEWPYARDIVRGLTARAVSPNAVAVTTRSPTSAPPGLRLHVVPAHVYAKDRDIDRDVAALGVADGAWHVTSRTADSVQLGVLGRPGGPPLDEIVFRSYPNTDELIDALADGDVDVISGLAEADIARLHALDDVTVDPVADSAGSPTVQAFRTDNVTGFLPEPARPRLVVFGPTISQYAGIVAASRPPGERLSDLTTVFATTGLLALCVAAYWIASRVRRRFVS